MFKKYLLKSPLLVPVYSLIKSHAVKCDSDNDEHDAKYYLVAKLSKQSVDNLHEYLSLNGHKCEIGTTVAVTPHKKKNDLYEFEPLFGERAAFRLKELDIHSDGKIHGKGRLSIMSGEIKDGDWVPSIDLKLSDNSTSVKTDSNVDPINITFPKLNQIVLECRLCRNDLVTSDGDCDFDLNEIVTTDDSHVSKDLYVHDPSTLEDGNDNVNSDPDECPVCRYMKAGPCRNEFIQWDSCVADAGEDEEAVKKCFSHTVTMMTCFKLHEYYDIMTAGTRPHIYNNASSIT